jgi:zinc-binding alcohol dehydrogenase family protein
MSTDTTAFGYSDNLPIDSPNAITARMVSVPVPGPHDLLVSVHAVSVNPVDVKLRANAPSSGFRVLGFDASGVVEAVGNAVTLFAPGDEVYYAGSIDRPGTNQLLQLVDERIVGAKPTTLTHTDAASLPLTALTAWESVFDRLGLTSDSKGSLLVVGASGGVGSILIQLMHLLAPEVRIIATASNAESAAWVTELGADEVVNHHEDLSRQVKKLAPEGVDWIFTAHSDGQIGIYADIARPFGQIVAIDDGARDVEPLKPKSISWHWELMFTTASQTPESTHQHEILSHVTKLVDAGRIKATTRTVLSPIDADTIREGHRLVETGRVMGKVVITNERV